MAPRKRSATPTAEMPARKKARDDDVYENKEIDDAIRREKMYDTQGVSLSRSKLTSRSGKQNAMNSLLLRLPPELRNIIYEYALGGREISFTLYATSSGNHFDLLFYGSHHRNILGLLFACRQMHSETALLPYKLNSFDFRGSRRFELRLFFERRSAEQIRAIRAIKALSIFKNSRHEVDLRTGLDWAKSLGLA
jgi:hypothetical protein